MIVHKEDAQEMWCPFVRLQAKAMDERDSQQVTVNRDYNGDHGIATRCLGPECMAWRWSPLDENNRMTDEPTRGYCGLAHKS